MRTVICTIFAACVLITGTVVASEKEDLFPSTSTDSSNWHRYRFYVSNFGSDLATNEVFTLLWDNPAAAVLLAIYDTSEAANPELVALSVGNDRLARIEVGLMDGTYQLIVIGVAEPTHYHMNAIYAPDESIFRQPDGQPFNVITQTTDLQIEKLLAPRVRQLEKAVNQ